MAVPLQVTRRDSLYLLLFLNKRFELCENCCFYCLTCFLSSLIGFLVSHWPGPGFLDSSCTCLRVWTRLAGAKFKPVSAWTYWLARTRIGFSLGLAATPLKSLEELVMLTSWRYGAPMERALQILLFSAVMYTALRFQDFSR